MSEEEKTGGSGSGASGGSNSSIAALSFKAPKFDKNIASSGGQWYAPNKRKSVPDKHPSAPTPAEPEPHATNRQAGCRMLLPLLVREKCSKLQSPELQLAELQEPQLTSGINNRLQNDRDLPEIQ
ncbi:hypothetical protein BLOT_015656 [Blomia tropicalis]|nr:hypothetical protein BLOT_015656 [Blomia tropicalis]